mgnify:CR=1 FL=1
MALTLDHLAITVSSMDASVQFYTGVFGFTEMGRWSSQPPARGRSAPFPEAGWSSSSPCPRRSTMVRTDDHPGIRHLCLRCEGLDSELARLERKGVRAVKSPMAMDTKGFQEQA